jgi:hypothetical protein
MRNVITFVARSLAVIFLTALPVPAATVVGPWIPKFKGVDFSVSTNLPGGGGELIHRQVVYALRVDLADPDVRLMATPRIATNYVAGIREIGGLTVSDFLRTNRLQAAINANFFSERNYYLPAGTPMDVYGLKISQGVVVSAQDESQHAATLMFDANNRPTIRYTNWPAATTEGVFTAVSGDTVLVMAGKNIAPRTGRLEANPRTAFGLSEDRRYLYLVAIDGRQPGYSEGAYDYETAAWLLLLGAYDGVNMDGGGSTTLVIQDTTGVPVRLNRSSAVADSGRERTVGGHLGIFAKPLSGFINDVSALPDDVTAKITWTTIKPSSTQVQYGLTESFGSVSDLQSELVTQHEVALTGLVSDTRYFYRVISSDGKQQYVSPNFSFVTKNYVTTNEIFGITNSWKYTIANLTGINWKIADYDDMAWSAGGAGLLWADMRATGPNPAVEPKNTPLPSDPATGFPYITYYFRTHFTMAKLVPGTSLAFSGVIDDGAVFYLNGAEIYRLRMPVSSTSQTLATGFPCDGDATCPDQFTIPSTALKNLVAGDNVLAVEVHNYNARSADTTFGLSLSAIEPLIRSPELKLHIQYSGAAITLTWDETEMILQSAASAAGPWTDVSSAASSPVTITPAESRRFYRLRR